MLKALSVASHQIEIKIKILRSDITIIKFYKNEAVNLRAGASIYCRWVQARHKVGWPRQHRLTPGQSELRYDLRGIRLSHCRLWWDRYSNHLRNQGWDSEAAGLWAQSGSDSVPPRELPDRLLSIHAWVRCRSHPKQDGLDHPNTLQQHHWSIWAAHLQKSIRMEPQRGHPCDGRAWAIPSWPNCTSSAISFPRLGPTASDSHSECQH